MLRYMVLGLALLSLGARADSTVAPALLQVRGEALVQVNADLGQISLGLESSGRDAERVIADNNRQMGQLVAKLKAAGVTAESLRTGSYSVAPQWSRRPQNADSNWQPSIVGYRVVNQLVLTTTELSHLPGWIQLAVEAGSNRIGQLSFSLADPDLHYRQALVIATHKAQAQAKTVAEAAGVTLGAIQMLQVESSQPQPMPGLRMEAMTMGAKAAPPPLEPGEISVHAAVSIQYRIEGAAAR